MASESNDLHGMVPDSNDTVLLLIDVINHLDFPGNEELLPIAEEIGKRIAKLKEAAHKAGIPVVYVNDNFGRWTSDFHNVIEYVINENKPGKPLAQLLQPGPDDYFVLKPKHSAFYCTPLDILLNHLDAETIILAGFAGNICVLFTANDAYMRNLKLIVPSDCIGSNTVEENNICLEQMHKLLKADIRPSDEIIKEINQMPKNEKTEAQRAQKPKKVMKK
ncbi:unnamed protein product [Adineta steineri]|uniref:Isochorismatase-like domain-containing protein n=1 Tax=Adineta steineri TaxID=433720 RepID=A0A815GUB8_9BILA|nr:unnamed protein product [Adineta steineri]CAF1344927.1 unnamed protein product [Adineta steineri]